MRTSSWLIGMTLSIAGIGGASATSMAAQNMDTGEHSSVDSGASHLNEGGGDALGVSRETSSRDSTEGRADTSTPSSHSRLGSTSTAPAPPSTRPSHMSWQSLLPGSIQ